MKYLILFLLCLSACSSMKNNSAEARADIEDTLKKWVGSASKHNFVEKWGKADWCKQEPTGEETCRFLTVKGSKMQGSTRYQKNYTTYDEVIATFGANEALKSYRVRVQK